MQTAYPSMRSPPFHLSCCLAPAPRELLGAFPPPALQPLSARRLLFSYHIPPRPSSHWVLLAHSGDHPVHISLDMSQTLFVMLDAAFFSELVVVRFVVRLPAPSLLLAMKYLCQKADSDILLGTFSRNRRSTSGYSFMMRIFISFLNQKETVRLPPLACLLASVPCDDASLT